MMIKIIGEVVCAYFAYNAGVVLSGYLKAHNIFHKLVSDYNVMKDLFVDDPKVLDECCADIQPIANSYAMNIAVIYLDSIKYRKQSLYLSFIFVLGFLIVSYYLGYGFLIANLIIYFIGGFSNISSVAYNFILSDISSIFLNIYKWEGYNHDECKEFCDRKDFSMLFKVAVEAKTKNNN